MKTSNDLEQYWSDLASILVRMKRFQKATEKYRVALGIPKSGFLQRLALQWYHALFKNETLDTRNRFAFESSRDLLPPNKFVIEQLEKFASEFNLDERWYIDLLFYLMDERSKLNTPYGGIDIDVQIDDPKLPIHQQVVTKLSIQINKDTAIKDIEDIWETVKQYQSKMTTKVPIRRRVFTNVSTYIKIRDLEDQNIPQREIAKRLPEIKNCTAADIATFKNKMEKRFNPQK